MNSPQSMVSNKITLRPEQAAVIPKIKIGSVLYGGTGSGKTYTSLVYYKKAWSNKLPLIVITTARVRDDETWTTSAKNVGVSDITVDSWNNIEKYVDSHAFFIFDEQKTLGYGKWSKIFIKIAKKNKWIMLSATPGDEWKDFMTLFIANGWYKSKTDFERQHVVYNPHVRFPQILRYVDEGILLKHRKDILIPMPVPRDTTRNRHYIKTDYDHKLYDKVIVERFNFLEERPVRNPSELTQLARRVVSMSADRITTFGNKVDELDRVIVFYNYEYERELIKRVLELKKRKYWEWNGKVHERLPDEDQYVYLVQYSANEGWNAINTNQVIFYSPNYSYKITEQAEGRIDRLNTSYKDLHYYYLVSDAGVDKAVLKAIARKSKFNESYWKPL